MKVDHHSIDAALARELKIMTYIIVKDRQTVIGTPHSSFSAALAQASNQFGDDAKLWMDLNLRVEENRPQ